MANREVPTGNVRPRYPEEENENDLEHGMLTQKACLCGRDQAEIVGLDCVRF